MTETRHEHTPGPWYAQEIAEPLSFGFKRKIYTGKSGGLLADCYSGNILDARLIAAAPDLLAACKALLAWSNPDGLECGAEVTQAEAAIAKAIAG